MSSKLMCMMAIVALCVGLTQAVRKAIGKGPGDRVHVVLRQDDAPRLVEIPEDLAAILNVDSV